VRDGKGETAGRKIIAIYDNGNKLKEINPAILWDLSPSDENADNVNVEIDEQKLHSFVIDAVETSMTQGDTHEHENG